MIPKNNILNMMDFHSHILPCMDDGAADVGEALNMLSDEEKQGVLDIVFTPHFYATEEKCKSFFERRKTALAELTNAYKGSLVFHLGAEVAYFPGIGHSKTMQDLTIDNSGFLLVEMPFATWNIKEVEDVVSLKTNLGITPIIAHIERYIFMQKRKVLKYLKSNGVFIQSNAEFFTDKRTSGKALKMLRKGMIDLLGTDAHNMKDRCPNMKEALDVISSECPESLERLYDNVDYILSRCKDIVKV